MPEILSLRALNRALLARQMLLAREPVPALSVIERLVGLQAQQARPPFIGLWSRISGFQREELIDLVRQKEAVRASMMRCTLHLMSRRDFLAFRPVLQPVLTYAMRTILQARTQTFDLDAVLAEARRLYARSPQTFTQIRDALVQLYPDADERAMGYTVRTHVPLVIRPAEHEWAYRADPEFALVEDWLNEPLSADEAAHELVRRYLAAFGPATVQDFQSWSGLQRMAPVFADLRPELVTFRDERKRELFDLPEAPRPAEDTPAPPCFIADYDNLTLAHADRTRIIAEERRKVIATNNGQILPLILIDGFVAGIWKARRERKAAVITVTAFGAVTSAVRGRLEAEGENLARFIDPEAAEFVVRIAPA